MRYEWRSWNHTLQPSYSKVIQACWRLADTYLNWRERQHSLCFKAHKMNILICCSNWITSVIVVLDVTLVCPQKQTNDWIKNIYWELCVQVSRSLTNQKCLSNQSVRNWSSLSKRNGPLRQAEMSKDCFSHVWKRFHYSIAAEQIKSKLNICWLQRIIGRRTYWMQMNLTLCWSLLYMLLSVCLCSYTTLNDATPPI